jgi:Zn-dependent protease
MFGSQSTRWHLFDLFGHRIYMEPFFLGLIALFSLMGISASQGGVDLIVLNTLIWAPTIFIGVLVHELGHALTLKYFGYGPSTIVLQAFGGVTINERRGDSPPGKSIAISLAGPAFSFLVALAAWLGLVLVSGGGIPRGLTEIGGVGSFFAYFFYIMALINVVWAVFNLLPINPLDGGHVVLHALRGLYKNRAKAMYYSAYSSLVVLGVLVVGSLLFPILDPFFLLIIAFFFGMQNWQILQQLRRGGPGGGRGPGMRV